MDRTDLAHFDENQLSNGAQSVIATGNPYILNVRIEGASSLLFHRWNSEAVEAKAKASKGSKAKKTDDLETYVYRDDGNNICLPGEYLRQAIIMSAKFEQDPRSSRKSAMDLFKAGIISLTELASLGVKQWDYEDRRRATIQRSSITRTRPAMKAGWEAEFDLAVQLPEYIGEDLLRKVLGNAGRLIGVGDFRPTYGRFHVSKWEIRN